MADKIKVALLGAGNVGSQAARILVEDNAVLEKRIGAPVELIGIAVRDTQATRHWNADPSLYTTCLLYTSGPVPPTNRGRSACRSS